MHLDLAPNVTFFIILGLVLLNYFVCGPLFFKPLVELFERREQEGEQRLKAAEEKMALATTKAEAYARQLAEGRTQAQGVRLQALREADEESRKQVETVRAELNAQFKTARTDIEKQVAASRQKLEHEVPKLARQMASQILGREV